MIFDGIAFFKEFNIPFTTDSPNVSQGWVGLKCPFCGDHSDHLGFNLSVGAFSCWRCGNKHTVDTIARLLAVPKQDATRIYAQHLVRNTLHNPDTGKPRRKANASQIILPTNDFTKLELAYLKKRNLLSVKDHYDLRSGGIVGDWAFRIVIPIKLNGVIVSATGRYIVDKEGILRYKTLPIEAEVIHHKHTFLGLDDISDSQTCILVEGPIDAMRGGKGFLSGFGMMLTQEQIALLSKMRYLAIMFDNEDQAYRQACKYAEQIAVIGSTEVEVIRLNGPYKDLGEMDDDAIADVRKELGLV